MYYKLYVLYKYFIITIITIIIIVNNICKLRNCLNSIGDKEQMGLFYNR